MTLLLDALSLPASSYYYAAAASMRPGLHSDVRPLIHGMAAGSGNTYGSLRMQPALRNRGADISGKAVRRLVKEERIDFYNNRGITAKLDGMAIAEHRDMLAKVFRKAP